MGKPTQRMRVSRRLQPYAQTEGGREGWADPCGFLRVSLCRGFGTESRAEPPLASREVGAGPVPASSAPVPSLYDQRTPGSSVLCCPVPAPEFAAQPRAGMWG